MQEEKITQNHDQSLNSQSLNGHDENFVVCIVTKIIQYINVTNIEILGKKVLILVDKFYGCHDFYEAIRKSPHEWSATYVFPSITQAYRWIHKNKKLISDIYTDSDCGAKMDILHWGLGRIPIHIYEEGVGTYLNTKAEENKKLKGFIQITYSKIFGNEYKYGGNRRTQEIIVYNPDYYKKNVTFERGKIVSTFRLPFLTHLLNSTFLFKNLNNEIINIRDSSVFVYISSWEIRDHQSSISYDYKILKPHPHLKKTASMNDSYDYVVPGDIPAEILLITLLKNNNTITVLSHMTTATLYFRNYECITFIEEFTPQHENHVTQTFEGLIKEIAKYPPSVNFSI